MPRAENSITIDRPVSEVFAFVSDPTNDMTWRPGVREISKVSGDGVGAVYRQRVSGPGGRVIAADIEITELEPDRMVGFHTISGPARPRGGYRLEAADGGTRLTFWLEAALGGLKNVLLGRMVAKTMDGEVENLANLKRVLEASP